LIHYLHWVPAAFWTPEGLCNTKQGCSQDVLIIQRCKIDHAITRFFDALGLGDNWLFLLRKP
jgi:hypothetical protein